MGYGSGGVTVGPVSQLSRAVVEARGVFSAPLFRIFSSVFSGSDSFVGDGSKAESKSRKSKPERKATADSVVMESENRKPKAGSSKLNPK